MWISKNRKKVTYSVKFIKELITYLNGLQTNEAKDFVYRLSVDKSNLPQMSEEEIFLRSLTEAERQRMLSKESCSKDSETLNMLKELSEERNSDNKK